MKRIIFLRQAPVARKHPQICTKFPLFNITTIKSQFKTSMATRHNRTIMMRSRSRSRMNMEAKISRDLTFIMTISTDKRFHKTTEVAEVTFLSQLKATERASAFKRWRKL